MADVGLRNISFFGPDQGTQSYIEPDGTFSYERNRAGAEFEFEVDLAADRTVVVRVVAFNGKGSLDALEKEAYMQLARILKALGEVAAEVEKKSE